jgi:hypothetical protein
MEVDQAFASKTVTLKYDSDSAPWKAPILNHVSDMSVKKIGKKGELLTDC